MSDPLKQFVDLLRDSGLLKSGQLQEVTSDLAPRSGDPRALAKELLQRGWLTPYQVNQLLQNRSQGLKLGQYLLLERLGEGGMGQVFKARHQSLHRTVALKIIRKDKLTNPDVVQRFRREMRAAGQLSHPNVVLAFDADEIEGTHYFVMEYVEGIDLAQLVRQKGPLPIADACQYVYQAALGLQHAHEKGLVHRDIKPHNLLLSKDRIVKILDMGLARVAELPEDTNFGTLTHDGKVMGTPDFMSPEQSRNSRTADIRADLYSLGCTLYFLLSGSVPFPGGVTLTEKLLKHQLDEPVPVEQLRPDVPVEVRQILTKMLAKKPEERYQTPKELAAELEPFAFGKPGTMASTTEIAAARTAPLARPLPSPSSGSWADTLSILEQFRGRPRWRKLAMAGGGGLLLLVLVVWLWPRSTTSSKGGAAALDALDASNIPAAERFAWQPKELVAVLGEHQGRNWDMCRSVAFAPDGKLVASTAADQAVHFFDVNTLREQTAQGWIGVPLSSVAYSPDGRYLVTGNRRDGAVHTWEVGGKKPLATIKLKGVLAADPVFSSDSQSVLIVDTDTTRRIMVLHAYQAVTGKVQAFPAGTLPGLLRGLAASAKSPLVAAAHADGKGGNTVSLFDLANRRVLPPLTALGIAGHATAIALAPDGSTVAVAGNGQVNLVDVARPNVRVLQKPWDQLAFSVAFSPDGTQVAAGFRGRVKIWDVATAAEKLSFQTHYGDVWGLAFSPDGRTLATTGDDHAVRLWDPASGVERVPVRGPTMALGFVAFTEDQRGVVAGLAERGEGGRIVETLKWWQLPELREQGSYQNPRGQPTRGAFARAGDTVLMLSAEKLDERRFSPVLTRWNLATGERKRLPLSQSAPGFMGLAVSDKLAASVAMDKQAHRVSLWNAETGTAVGSLDGGDDAFAAVAIAPDARTIATAGWGTHLDLWDAATRKVIKNIEIDARDGVGQLLFAPDGKSVAALDHHGKWRIWDLDKNRITVKCDDVLGTGSTLQFAPDGKVLAAGDADGRLEIWSVATGKPTGEAWRLPGPIHGLAFSDNGRYLATINGNGTVYILRRAQ